MQPKMWPNANIKYSYFEKMIAQMNPQNGRFCWFARLRPPARPRSSPFFLRPVLRYCYVSFFGHPPYVSLE